MTIIGKVRKGNAGKAFGCIAVIVLCAIAMSPKAMASTVAYWPLAGENGVWTTQGDVFQNSATPGTMDAISTVIRCRDGYVAPSSGVHAKDYPAGTNAFPTAYGVYDPVAKESLAAATGLDFGRDSFVNNWNTSQSCCWIAGALRVADPDALKLSTFTVEFFVKPDPSYKSREQVVAAMQLEKMPSNYTFGKASWSIGLDGNNCFYTTFAYADGTSAKTFKSDPLPWLFDDRWHHVAITVSGTSFKMFVDYVVVRSGTLSQEVNYAADGDLFLGGTTHAKFSYAGSMSHVRVSDEALTSENFLHFTRTTRAEDEADDVVFHLDFEPVDGLSTNRTVVFNRAATGSAVHLHSNDNYLYPTYAAYDTDVYTNKLYASRKDSKGYDNSMSYSKTANNTKYPYLAWYPDEDVFHDYSFTIEMFMKTASKSPWTPYLRRRVDPVASGAVQVTMATDKTAGHLSCGFASPRANGTVLLNEWQHLAFVYDRTTGSFSLFQNWAQVGSNTMPASSIGTATNTPITLFGDAGSDNSSFIGNLDEVRITKRALGVKEFLTPKRAQGFIIIVL